MWTRALTALRGLLQRRRAVHEMDDELAFHVEMETRANVARGMPLPEARRAALRDLGGLTQTREAIREVRIMSIESLVHDVVYAVRTLRSRPGFALAAIAMLGIGIGVTTAMFTILDALILRPVPFHASEDLAFVYMGSRTGGRTTVAPAVLRAWRESPAFAGAESAAPETALVEVGGTVVTRGLARVTPGLFEMLGNVRPVRGRVFDRSEGRTGTDDRVLLSEDIWRGLYGGDEGIIGRQVTIGGESLTVIGVLPSEFRFPSWDTELWRPIDLEVPPPAARNARATAYIRFAPGMPRTEALRLATETAHAADATTAKLEPRSRPVAGMVLDRYSERAVPLLAGGVVLVFLVLCANVCSLLLARLTERRREFSMRAALGASRGRLMRQAIVESAVLGALGVLSGAAVGWALVSLARTFLPEAFLLRTLNPLNVDVRALVVTSASGIVATFAAGLLPAWIGTRVNAGDSLRVVDRGGTEARGARAITRGLLVIEIALACTLLVCATLLVRSFVNLSRVDRGLDASGVITATMSLPATAFPDATARASVARVIEDKLRQLPGIERIAWSMGVPPQGGGLMFGEWSSDVPQSSSVNMTVEQYSVSEDFFALYRIPLLRGRTFEPGDTPNDVVIGERLAAAFWPGSDAVGRSFRHAKTEFRVIGVAREIHYPSLDPNGVDRPELYNRFAGVGSYAFANIRCAGACPPPAVLRKQIGAAHPAVRPMTVQQLEQSYFEELARPRAAAALGFAFATIAVIAAAGGLFSVLTYAVGRRRREFGIRSALGASPSEIRRVVFRDGLAVTVIGVTIGAVVAIALGRGIASLQYGVTVADPVTWATVIAVLATTNVIAAWRPAREATHVDPVRLLRED